MPFGTALGVLQGVSGVASTLGGFFNNSAAQQAHAQNVQRVAQINAENQKRLFGQLQVNSRFENQKARVQANLDNIEVSGMQARARSQQKIDDVVDEFMLNNQDKYVQMAQKLSGNRAVDRSMSAMRGRNLAGGMSQIRNAQDKMMTGNMQLARTMQEARAKELSTVATAPIQTKYIESYTPARAPGKGFMDYLNLASGLAGSVVGGFETYDKFKPQMGYTGNSSLKIGGFDTGNFEFGMNNPMDLGYDLGPIPSFGGYNP